MLAVTIALVLGVLGLALWYGQQYPRRIVSEGMVWVGRGGGKLQRLRTRDVRIGDVTLREVEMPNGTWLDCDGDCAKAAHEAGAGFWDKQNRERR